MEQVSFVEIRAQRAGHLLACFALPLTRDHAAGVVNGSRPRFEGMAEITLANDPHEDRIVVTLVVTFSEKLA